MLAKGDPIPAEFSPHPLRGRWKNHMECHVEDDYLLIWYEKEMDIFLIHNKNQEILNFVAHKE